MNARRQEILDAALALADERGVDAVSMRAVAERVGVTPMALYPHVGSKAALLDGMVGRLLAEILEPDRSGESERPDNADEEGTMDWRERLGNVARATRRLGRRHPWAAALLFSRPSVTPDGVRAVDQVYAALLDAGVPRADVPRLERMVSTFVLGYVASEAGGRFGRGDPRGRRGRLPEGTLPAHDALTPWLEAPVDWDAEFEADLDDLRRLIEAAAR
jgi:AcrR family transcriptional regulator